MTRALPPVLTSVLGLGVLGLGPLALLTRPIAPDAMTLLVVVPPWEEVGAVVGASGGRPIGLGARSWSALVAGASPQALREAGAWIVLDGDALSALCGTGPTDDRTPS